MPRKPREPRPDKPSFAGPLKTKQAPTTKVHACKDGSVKLAEKPWPHIFLESLARHGVVARACKAADVSEVAAYKARKRSEKFARRWHAALVLHRKRKVQSAEHELYRRGVDGWIEPIYQGGELVGHKNKHSDACLVRVLEAERPRKYAKRSESHTTSISVAFNADARSALLDSPEARAAACVLAELLAQPKAIEVTGQASEPASDRPVASEGSSA